MSRHRWRISHHRKHNGSRNANHFKSSKCHQYPGHQLQFPFHSPLAVTPPQLETVELPDHHWPPKRCCADSRNPAVGGFVWDQSKETGVGSRESGVQSQRVQIAIARHSYTCHSACSDVPASQLALSRTNVRAHYCKLNSITSDSRQIEVEIEIFFWAKKTVMATRNAERRKAYKRMTKNWILPKNKT